MSNYSSVILAFSAPDLGDLGMAGCEADCNEPRAVRAFVEAAFADLGGYGWCVRDTTWAHGLPAGDTMCCETVVRFCINYFDPDDFWAAVLQCAPWLAAAHMEAQAWWKDEGADAYTEIPR